jgi:hypothetical protein
MVGFPRINASSNSSNVSARAKWVEEDFPALALDQGWIACVDLQKGRRA